MGDDAELREKLKALLSADRELREMLEEFDDGLADDLDFLDSFDAAALERWSDLLRELRRSNPPQTPEEEQSSCGADIRQYFDRR